jgi:integrase
MAKKNVKTECSALEWSQFLYLVERLKKANDCQFMLLVSIGGYCGLRIGDILSLRWIDIVEQESIEVVEGKTGKRRKVSINLSLKDIISHCYQNIKTGNKPLLTSNVFVNRTGNVLSRQYINRRLHSIFQKHKLKLQNNSSHVLRKTFGKRVFEMNDNSEAALILLSSIFNHSSTAITRRYIGLSQTQIQDCYLNL